MGYFKKDHSKNLKKFSLVAIAAVGLLALPFLLQMIFGNEYWVMVVCIMMIYIIAVSGLDILFGYSGQPSMGHAAFFAIGAYTSCMLNNYYGTPLYITIPLGAVLSTVIGGLLAYPASKLKFHFLALATIAFGEIVYNFVMVSPGDFTGNYRGAYVAGIGILKDYTYWYFFLLLFVIIALLGKSSLYRSRVGRALLAIRENTHAADGMGVNVQKYKIIAFMVSAFYTGLAGALYGHMIGYISPEIAKIRQSALLLTMLLFGGTGSIAGPIIGVIILEIMLELIRPFQEYQLLLYGILMIIVIVGVPGGISGGIKDMIVALKRRRMVKRNTAQEQMIGKDGD